MRAVINDGAVAVDDDVTFLLHTLGVQSDSVAMLYCLLLGYYIDSMRGTLNRLL